jgi:DNA-3-methyladenine glycosylase II
VPTVSDGGAASAKVKSFNIQFMSRSSGSTASAGPAAAVRHLRRADPVLGALIGRIGPCRLAVRAQGTHFEALARSIVYQQLSGTAAGTIHGRLVATLGSVTPEQVVATPDESLRAAGLSRQKVTYLRDLAAHATQQRLDIERLHELGDDQIIETLSAVKGIGRWTAQMFLIFRLGRPDVLPELDLGVRKGARLTYRMRSLPSVTRLSKLGRRWAPYRSYASWYLWRAVD